MSKPTMLPKYDIAAGALYNLADRHHAKLLAQAKREVLTMYRLGEHIERGQFSAARRLIEKNEDWMDMPKSVYKILYTEAQHE